MSIYSEGKLPKRAGLSFRKLLRAAGPTKPAMGYRKVCEHREDVRTRDSAAWNYKPSQVAPAGMPGGSLLSTRACASSPSAEESDFLVFPG